MNDPLDQLRLRFSGLRLISETGHGQVYSGQDFTGAEVTVAVLSEAAAADPGTRNAFADAVWRHSPGAVPEAAAVHAADLHAGRPWAAIRNPAGQPGAEQLFAGLGASPGPAAAAGSPVAPFGSPAAPATPPPPTAPAYPPPTAPAYPPAPGYPPASGYPPAPGTPPPPTAPAYPPASGYSPAPGTPPPAAPASPAGYLPPAAPASPAGYLGSSAAYPPPAAPASPAAYGQGYGGYGPPPGAGQQPGFGADPGLPGGQPAKPKSPWPWLITVGASVVALVVLVGVVVVAVRMFGGDDVDRPITLPPQTQPNAPPPTGEPLPPPPPSEDEPALREDAEPVSLIGPSFGEDEDTFTMAFGGWPFAFRTPGSWGCLAGEFEPIPEALVWNCIDEGDTSSGQRVSVMLWECPTSCTADEQDEMISRWLDEPEAAERQEDPLVAYVEYEENTNGNWAIDLSHFGGAGGDLRWHVGVYAESPPDTQETVQKILNDILTQAS